MLVLNEEGTMIDRPDLLEKWLESPEGQEFINKYKLFHLKKDKTKPYVIQKKQKNTSEANKSGERMSIRMRLRYSTLLSSAK